jgi:hypothetical protein
MATAEAAMSNENKQERLRELAQRLRDELEILAKAKTAELSVPEGKWGHPPYPLLEYSEYHRNWKAPLTRAYKAMEDFDAESSTQQAPEPRIPESELRKLAREISHSEHDSEISDHVFGLLVSFVSKYVPAAQQAEAEDAVMRLERHFEGEADDRGKTVLRAFAAQVKVVIAALKSSQQEDGAYTRGFNAGRRDMAAAHVAEQAKLQSALGEYSTMLHLAVEHLNEWAKELNVEHGASIDDIKKLVERIKLASEAKAQEAHQNELERLDEEWKKRCNYCISDRDKAERKLAAAEQASLASQAKLIRKCAGAICQFCADGVPFIKEGKYVGRHECPPGAWSQVAEGVYCYASAIITLITPAMLQAEEAEKDITK